MTVLSETRYRAITGDISTDSCAVTGAIADAQLLVEAELCRPLDYLEDTTETLVVYRDAGRGHVYPRRYPVLAVPTDAAYGIVGRSELIDVTPAGWPSQWPSAVAVTFTGGWRARDDEEATAADTIPIQLEQAIADLAHGIVTHRQNLLVGVTAATVGDVSVTYASGAGGLDSYTPGIRARIAGYKYRPYL